MPNTYLKVGFFLLSIVCVDQVSFAQMKEVITLDRKLDSLRADFDAHKDDTRLLFIVGPTCDVCRKGLKNMKNVVLNNIQESAKLAIFVIHVPALDAKEGDIESTYSLFDDPRARHYWDEHGTSGIRFQRTLDLPVYAWDVWMIYPPGATWDQKDPPVPQRWWHQLESGPMKHHLDPDEFAAELNRTLHTANRTIKGEK